MKKIILIVFLFLIVFSLSVFAFNSYKINNTFIKIDYKLNDTEILSFVDNFDLSNLNSIYFLNMDKYYSYNYPYDGGGKYTGLINGIYYYNFKQIVIYRMSKDINVRGDSWRETFCHEHAHHIGWTKYKDLSEKFALNYCDGDKN